MAAPEPKKPTYRLLEVARKWDCEIDDLFYYAEEGILQICKQQNIPIVSLFDSDEEKEAASKFSNDPIQIDHREARQLEKEYRSYPDHAEPISLVITYQEKKRFEDKYKIGLGVGSDQEEPTNTTHPQEKLPTFIVGPNDVVWGYANISKIIDCHPDNVLKLHKKENLPLRWSGAKPYSSHYRLVSWIENRGGNKRKTAKNFKKNNPS